MKNGALSAAAKLIIKTVNILHQIRIFVKASSSAFALAFLIKKGGFPPCPVISLIYPCFLIVDASLIS